MGRDLLKNEIDGWGGGVALVGEAAEGKVLAEVVAGGCVGGGVVGGKVLERRWLGVKCWRMW